MNREQFMDKLLAETNVNVLVIYKGSIAFQTKKGFVGRVYWLPKTKNGYWGTLKMKSYSITDSLDDLLYLIKRFYK